MICFNVLAQDQSPGIRFKILCMHACIIYIYIYIYIYMQVGIFVHLRADIVAIHKSRAQEAGLAS